MRKIVFFIVLLILVVQPTTAMESKIELKAEDFDDHLKDSIGYIVEAINKVNEAVSKEDKEKAANAQYGVKGNRKRPIEWCVEVYGSVIDQPEKLASIITVIESFTENGAMIPPQALVGSLLMAATSQNISLVTTLVKLIGGLNKKNKQRTLRLLTLYRKNKDEFVDLGSFRAELHRNDSIYVICIRLSALVHRGHPDHLKQWLTVVRAIVTLSKGWFIWGLVPRVNKNYIEFILDQNVPGLIGVFAHRDDFRNQTDLLNKILDRYIADKATYKYLLDDMKTICSLDPTLIDKKSDHGSRVPFRESVLVATSRLMGKEPDPQLSALLKLAPTHNDSLQKITGALGSLNKKLELLVKRLELLGT